MTFADRQTDRQTLHHYIYIIIFVIVIVIIIPDYDSPAESKVLDYKHQFPASKVPTFFNFIIIRK